eukprot:g15988.t1
MTESAVIHAQSAVHMRCALSTAVLATLFLGLLALAGLAQHDQPRRLPRCSMSGTSCHTTQCCALMHDRCFQQAGEASFCRASCAPREGARCSGWSCHEPFAHPLAKARHTEDWPDIMAVCSAGMVLVERNAFHVKYNATCDQYCQKGAGPSVRASAPDLCRHRQQGD